MGGSLAENRVYVDIAIVGKWNFWNKIRALIIRLNSVERSMIDLRVVTVLQSFPSIIPDARAYVFVNQVRGNSRGSDIFVRTLIRQKMHPP